jgi:undecaprenyl-diphosphatase
MNIIEALILGIVQGLTEFIPVSSSGHLVLLHDWLGVEQSGLAFDVALHFGTLLALLLFFRKDISQLIVSVFKGGPQRRVAIILAVATIPAVIAGFLLNDLAESTFRSSRLVAMNLILIAILMLIAERYYKKHQHKTQLEKVSMKQGLAVGIAQAVALVPGTSRSGITITTGLFAGLDRLAATRFSFLLGIPVMCGAILKIFVLDGGASQVADQPVLFTVGITAAFASGLFAIAFMLKFLAKHTLDVFAYYRIGIGLLVLIFSVV